jgi:hypothetical protein
MTRYGSDIPPKLIGGLQGGMIIILTLSWNYWAYSLNLVSNPLYRIEQIEIFPNKEILFEAISVEEAQTRIEDY